MIRPLQHIESVCASISLLLIMWSGLMGFADSASAQGVNGLDVQISVNQQQFKSDQDLIQLTVTMINNTDGDIFILKWNTPFDSTFGQLNGDLFEVRRGGEKIPYIGPIFKRSPPTQEDYIKLTPGEAKRATVDLEDGYAIVSSGPYTVVYRSNIVSTQRGDSGVNAIQRLTVEDKVAVSPSNTINFVLLEGRALRRSEQLSFDVQLKARFEKCTTSQKSQLQTALSKSQEIAREALDALRSTSESRRPDAPRYKEWFGSYRLTRYQTVKSNFEKIETGLRRPDVAINCQGDRCENSVYAYVFSLDHYRMYVCGAFGERH